MPPQSLNDCRMLAGDVPADVNVFSGSFNSEIVVDCEFPTVNTTRHTWEFRLGQEGLDLPMRRPGYGIRRTAGER